MVTTILGVVRTGHHLEHTDGARDSRFLSPFIPLGIL